MLPKGSTRQERKMKEGNHRRDRRTSFANDDTRASSLGHSEN